MSSFRLPHLSPIARLATFARHDGPAVLITTEERLELFDCPEVFGINASQNPSLPSWHNNHDKVILSLEHALKAFPNDPSILRLELKVGENYAREALLERLVDYGFERDELPGFVVKGDTITLHLDEDEEDTVRLEFFGDELDGIKHNDKVTKFFVLTPLAEADFDEGAWESRLLEHLEGRVFLDASELFAGELSELASDVARLEWFWEYLTSREVTSFGRDSLDLAEESSDLQAVGYYRGKLDNFSNDAEMWLKDGFSVHLVLRFERTGRYLREKVIDQLETKWAQHISHDGGVLSLSVGGRTRGGYRDNSRKEVVISEDLLYGYQGVRRLRRLKGRAVGNAAQLSVGDYLIHPDHGIGLFEGLEPRQVLGVVRDYLIVKYAAEGKLYLPVEQLPLLRRHPGTTDDPPRLSTLGTNEWARARQRARASAQELAQKLIRTYAERQVAEGVPLPAIPAWDAKMDETFPFTLTPDQASAIEAIYEDMSRDVPMDRLISGDVGFGKTEVALRAAHRAVGHSKQVVMLVPTTVLAKQHYETFLERFKDLPVTVEMLSRFTSTRNANSTLKGLKTGSVDILIGTHRVLSDDITFKDLGLLIIDEEHRFGVGQKERMKGLKTNLDVLSLSATPIPRTLYMSLIGLRDVSQIMTPPSGRQPIETVLSPYERSTIRDAILFELERGGKVFYIHDRVGSMGSRSLLLNALVPEARIGVAHGQMSADDLESVMIAFQDGMYDVLLATTIVESGLDISGANTLIIERADRLGLAQLYQLRGRVGRRNTAAYAYLLYPGKLTEKAQRRLYAIAELNDLGSGHLLAEKDMEIRGVGNLLGPEQHGNIAAVSIEVYTEMLAEEIAKLKGEEKEIGQHASIDLSIDARLSAHYVPNDDERIEIYGKLSASTSLVEIGRVRNELRSSYGPLPSEVQNFLDLIKLRLLASQKGVLTISEHMSDIQLTFDREEDKLDYDAAAIRRLKFDAEPTRYPPGFSIKKRGLKEGDVLKVLLELLYKIG